MVFSLTNRKESSRRNLSKTKNDQLLFAHLENHQSSRKSDKQTGILQVNNYEIVVNFFHISHNLT